MPVRVLFSLGLLGLVGPATLEAQAKSAKAPGESNVQNCIKGLSGCDVSALMPDEIKQVAQASRKRNLDSCMEGSTLCDPTRLTGAEAKSVEAARYRRNLDKCMTGSFTCE